MQDLTNTLEAALKYRVEESNGATHAINIYTGQGDYEKQHPSLVIHAEGGSENPQGSGNFTLTVQCELRTSADTRALPEWRELERDIFAALMMDNLAAQLSGEADNLFVFGISNRSMRGAVEENEWLSVLSFDAYCCRSDLS